MQCKQFYLSLDNYLNSIVTDENQYLYNIIKLYFHPISYKLLNWNSSKKNFKVNEILISTKYFDQKSNLNEIKVILPFLRRYILIIFGFYNCSKPVQKGRILSVNKEITGLCLRIILTETDIPVIKGNSLFLCNKKGSSILIVTGNL